MINFVHDVINSTYTMFMTDNLYVKKSSVLDKIGLPIANQTAALFCSTYNYGFSFIQTTKNYLILKMTDITALKKSIELIGVKKSMKTMISFYSIFFWRQY